MHDNWDTQITQCETKKICVAKISCIILVQLKKVQSFEIYNLCPLISCIILTAHRNNRNCWVNLVGPMSQSYHHVNTHLRTHIYSDLFPRYGQISNSSKKFWWSLERISMKSVNKSGENPQIGDVKVFIYP